MSDAPPTSTSTTKSQTHSNPTTLNKSTSTSSHPPTSSQDPTTASSLQDEHSTRRFPSPSASGSAQLPSLKMSLKAGLRQFPDFPSPGILFEDIMPLFADPSLHTALITALELQIAEVYSGDNKPEVLVGLDARGFLFAPSLALRMGISFVPVRKKGKLPGPCVTASYKKEYGEDLFQMQSDGVKQGQRVLIIDDIIATGGSAAAAGSLVKQLGGHLLGYLFIMELDFLKGRDKLDAPVTTLLSSQ